MDYKLTETQRMVGFYGAHSETNISQLGVIVQDSDCSSKARTELARQRRAVELAEADDSGFIEKFSWYVILAWAGLIVLTIILFLTIATCIRCCCKDKKKHKDCSPAVKTPESIEMQDQQPDERCDTARPMNHYMQTEGGDDESPAHAMQEEVQPDIQNEEEAMPPSSEDVAPADPAVDQAAEEPGIEEEAANPVEADNEI